MAVFVVVGGHDRIWKMWLYVVRCRASLWIHQKFTWEKKNIEQHVLMCVWEFVLVCECVIETVYHCVSVGVGACISECIWASMGVYVCVIQCVSVCVSEWFCPCPFGQVICGGWYPELDVIMCKEEILSLKTLIVSIWCSLCQPKVSYSCDAGKPPSRF
jgi:hypothetical protein